MWMATCPPSPDVQALYGIRAILKPESASYLREVWGAQGCLPRAAGGPLSEVARLRVWVFDILVLVADSPGEAPPTF